MDVLPYVCEKYEKQISKQHRTKKEKKMIQSILCYFNICHVVIKDDEGIHCIHCGYFKSRYEIMADYHAGCGGL